ncbi:MAG: allophanate hydrolase subunit 1, partial [candidate division NC10 bacterium]|nr:allophanate hydrolase subunit 1 [candidate division NC10 bacterium]
GGLRFLPAGERGLVVEIGNEVSLEINDQVRALAFALAALPIPGLVEIVPTYRSIGLEYDPLTISFDEVEQRVREVATRIDPRVLPAPKLVRIPTVYGGIYGPDLPFVAEHAGLGEAEAIRLHSQPTYHVFMIGFTPGYTYLGGLPERLHTPRLQSPRLKVPKGSVGIGGRSREPRAATGDRRAESREPRPASREPRAETGERGAGRRAPRAQGRTKSIKAVLGSQASALKT